MLVIWLQGIWLPIHGYSYEDTPIWAGIYMLPMTVGFLLAGPLAGWLSDRHGARMLSTAGLVVFGLSFLGLLMIPADFNYFTFGALLLVNGIGGGLFSAPNSTAVMNSVQPNERGGAAGIQSSLMNTGMVLSMGVFFSLMIAGLATSLPSTVSTALVHQGVPIAVAHGISQLPPAAILFASFLGFNPLQSLLGSQAAVHVTSAQWKTLIGKQFFPAMIQQPFHFGLVIVFSLAFAIAMVAAVFSALRGKHAAK
jgi:MFS family permease